MGPVWTGEPSIASNKMAQSTDCREDLSRILKNYRLMAEEVTANKWQHEFPIEKRYKLFTCSMLTSYNAGWLAKG